MGGGEHKESPLSTGFLRFKRTICKFESKSRQRRIQSDSLKGVDNTVCRPHATRNLTCAGLCSTTSNASAVHSRCVWLALNEGGNAGTDWKVPLGIEGLVTYIEMVNRPLASWAN